MRLEKRKSQSAYRRTLSDREANILADLSYKGNIIFSPDDLRIYVSNPKSIIDSLIRKKWILKIKKEKYLIVPLEAGKRGAEDYTVHSFVIASVLANPYYIGYISALNFHGLTDRTPSAVYIVTQEPHESRTILDTKFKFVTIVPRKFFGINEIRIENRKVRVSSKEKTIVDCLDRPEYCEGIDEVARAIFFGRKELDFCEVVSLSKKIGNSAALKRLGYISERLNITQLKRLTSHLKVASGYSLLDRSVTRKGKIVERWGIIANASIDPERWMQ